MPDTTNPFAPGAYEAGYDPSASEPGAGSGGEFGADLFELYFAGLTTLPTVADQLAAVAADLHTRRSELSALSSLLQHELPSQIQSLVDLVQDALGITAQRSHQAGRALVQIADRYVATDEVAVGRFNKLLNGTIQDSELGDPSIRERILLIRDQLAPSGWQPPPTSQDPEYGDGVELAGPKAGVS